MPSMTTAIKKHNLGKCCNIYNQDQIIDIIKKIAQKPVLNKKNPLIKNIVWESQKEKFLKIFKF